MNDKIIDRLTKLLALAGNNPSQAEANAAMAKAQAVAIEHGIDLALIGKVDDNSEITLDEMRFGQRLPTVNNYVSDILVKFFNVKIILSGSRDTGRKLIFGGKGSDIETAKYIYTWLAETMVRCWHRYYDTGTNSDIDREKINKDIHVECGICQGSGIIREFDET